MRVVVSCFVFVASVATDQGDFDELQKDLQAIVESRAKKWNCSFSVAVHGPSLGATLTVVSDGTSPNSKFAWGSITKMWTGAAIMQLVSQGKLTLDEPFAPYVDAQLAAMKSINFPGMNFTRVRDLWGPQVEGVSIRDLIHMQSGIPDFDTAEHNPLKKDLDPFRAAVYASPKVDFLEPTLMSLPWVATHELASTPGRGFRYSSTNFGLLGLVLAHHAGIADYRDFNQSFFIPSALSDTAKHVHWAQRGSPRENGVVPAYDRTDYNGQDPQTGGISVVDVHGVFSGWSASNFVGPPSAVAELGYALWGNASSLLPAQYRDMMVPSRFTFYGLASQNVGLMGIAGGEGEFARAYGHLGATYGYDSIFGYNPKLDVGIAVATNIETQTQAQPADAYCAVYNRIKNHIMREPVETCTYKASGFFGRGCRCEAARAAVIV